MLTYKNKVLIKFKDKKGGKNQSEVDGFYRDTDGNEFFIKKPNDPKELFTELFAGLLLQEFKRRSLIDKIYHDSLICADLIQFENGSYGLIQPKINFKELYKVIGTAYRDSSDRDPLWEMFCGPQHYLSLTQLRQYYGLAIALMFSLLLGDNSVHSGNVICMDVPSAAEMEFIQFARIDWGASFRYFGHEKNNQELLYPFEYQGWFNPKSYTKGYFLNYKKIKGLFPAIAEQANQLQKQVDEELLAEIVASVLNQLPVDLIDNATKIGLAKYMCVESFNQVSFGEGGSYQQFSRDLAKTLFDRLQKITCLQDFSCTATESDLSPIKYVESLPTAITLPVNLVTPFADQIRIWFNILSSSDERSVFDFNSIERDKLAKQFDNFMGCLLRQAERVNQYSEDNSSNIPSNQTSLPWAMEQFFRCQFILDHNLKPYSSSEEKKPYNSSYWDVVETLLTTSFNAIVTIRVLQDTQNSAESAKSSAIYFLFDALKDHLKTFTENYQVFIKELEKKLSSMSNIHLTEICIKEMEFMDSSLLIGIILRDPILWTRMNKTIEEHYKDLHDEKAEHQIIKLQQIHKDLTSFLSLAKELPLITKIDTQSVLANELNRLFGALPEFLQSELAPALNKIQDEFRENQRLYSIELEELRKFTEDCNLSAETKNITPPSMEICADDTDLTKPQVPLKQQNELNADIDVNRSMLSNLLFFIMPGPNKLPTSNDESIVKKNNLLPREDRVLTTQASKQVENAHEHLLPSLHQ